MILFFVPTKPALDMITETVDPDSISLAFAVQMVALKIFGTIPFLIILGEIIIANFLTTQIYCDLRTC
jgi:hypothetical protein